ncbi:MAG TPA: alpha/beta hydrolase [Magnetospirillum sp.]|jgi:esterase/lipase|nr:alpha/beta hydrolase [Magnetospirillum sp.]
MSFLARFTLVAALMLAAASAQAADRIGIILMHGKQGSPDKSITSLASALSSEGYLVATPEMCWSKRRIYDKPYEACIAELDKAAESLRADGATAIVVAGHSLGGNGALYYAATRPVKAVVSLAGAHNPERFVSRSEIAESLAKAKTMIADGRGAETANFNEVNSGWTFTVSCSADTYASFFDPAGSAVMPQTIARIQAPILWVSGDRDKGQQAVPAIFAKAPANPLNRHVVVSADHLDTPDAAIPAVREWLRGVAAQ